MKMPRPIPCPECSALAPAAHKPRCTYAADGREPFDPGDPTDAMSEMFRRQVTDMALEAYKITIYRDLNPQQQLECFLAGALTGVVGVCLASIKTEDANEMMEYIGTCLPIARELAESIADENGRSVINHHDARPHANGEEQR